jgi:hypothetical protein
VAGPSLPCAPHRGASKERPAAAPKGLAGMAP